MLDVFGVGLTARNRHSFSRRVREQAGLAQLKREPGVPLLRPRRRA